MCWGWEKSKGCILITSYFMGGFYAPSQSSSTFCGGKGPRDSFHSKVSTHPKALCKQVARRPKAETVLGWGLCKVSIQIIWDVPHFPFHLLSFVCRVRPRRTLAELGEAADGTPSTALKHAQDRETWQFYHQAQNKTQLITSLVKNYLGQNIFHI